ncbi:MAG: DUF2782 domain-containing protein [Gammaproteobacteria bacterium]|nr:DUF2782 domain-containing protein [Gammaproteobacteria bacterium]
MRGVPLIINLSRRGLWVLGLCASLALANDPAPVPAAAAQAISSADEVIITEEGEQTTYEYRLNGELRLIRVVPAVGPEYYLYPEDQTLEGGIDQSDALLVRWKLLEF